MSLPEYQEHMDRSKWVRTLIETCNRCPLGQGTNRVPYGGVSWRPKLVLLGEAPGLREDRLREPFVGPAGQLLDRILDMIGLTRNHVMIANTVCCRPPQNRDPDWYEIQTCEMNRKAQIRLGNSWVGVTLGRVALAALTDNAAVSVGTFKGKGMWIDDMVWVPTYHPAYALRNKKAVSEIASHLKVALDIKEGKKDAPLPKTNAYRMEGRTLIVDHDGVKVPKRIRELAEVTFTKEEWVKLTHTGSSRWIDLGVSLKREMAAEVIS